MNPTQNEQAFAIIEQALNVGTKAGAYQLREAVLITQALDIIKGVLGVKEPSPQAEAVAQA